MTQIAGGILALVLGVGLIFALLRSREKEDSVLMRFDDLAVVVIMGLLVMGAFFAVSGVAAGPGPAEAAIAP